MTEVILSPVLEVRGRGPGRSASLMGPLFVDIQTSDLFAFGVAQSLNFQDREITAVHDPDGDLLSDGTPYVFLKPWVDQPVEALLVGVRLKLKHIDTHPYERFTPTPLVVRAQWPSHNNRLRVLGRNGALKEAKLVSLASSFSMPNPLTGALSSFDDALELEAVGDTPLIQRGEAGALVLDPAGNWVGVVVAGSRTSAFAAPLLPMIDRLKLTAPTLERVQASNKRLNRAPETTEATAEFELSWSGPISTQVLSRLNQSAKSVREDVAFADLMLT